LAGNVVQLDGTAKLPAVDGSQLTNLPAAPVTSVAGKTGAVTLVAGDISGLATVATTGAYSDLTGTPTLATVATTGAYSDLTGTPTLATVATTGAYSDLTGTPTLGTAAAEDVGTLAGNVVQLDGSARLPAVDGSQLTNLPSGASTLGALTDVDVTGAVNTNVLKYNSTSGDWEDGAVAYAEVTGTPTLATVATTGAYSDLTGTPSLATVATTGAYSDLTGTPTLGTAAALDVGTSANNVVQLNGSAQLPAVDGSQLTNLPSASVAALGDIGDVTITSVADGQFLKYDSVSGDWVNSDSGLYAYYSFSTTSTLAAPAQSQTLVVSLSSSLSQTLTLPTGSNDFAGTTISFANLNSGEWTIAAASGNYIRGLSTAPTLAQNQAIILTLASSNTWLVVAYEEQGLGSLADVDVTGAVATNVLKYDGTDWVDGAVAYSEVTGTPTLGTAAALDVGTSANNVVQLNGSAQLPAVDGSLLTGITATVAALNDIGDVSAAAPNNGDVIAYNSTSGDWEATAQSGGGSAPSVTVSSPSTDQTLTSPSGIEEVYVYTPTTAITVNLVAAATCGSGFKYQVKNRSSNTLTIDPNGTETIDGSTTYSIATQEASVTLITDGSNWFII